MTEILPMSRSPVVGARRLPAGTAAQQPSAVPIKWQVDVEGNLLNFDLRALRNDILVRIRGGYPLYTTEECRKFVLEMIRIATAWQEEELGYLLYLADLNQKVLPGKHVAFQWPVSAMPHIPFCEPADPLQGNPIHRITQVVEELNRSLIRMIDRLWNDRRERLLLASAMLEGLEEASAAKDGGGDE